jgi:hypothetical protein
MPAQYRARIAGDYGADLRAVRIPSTVLVRLYELNSI